MREGLVGENMTRTPLSECLSYAFTNLPNTLTARFMPQFYLSRPPHHRAFFGDAFWQ
jgi:hypothetical protein